jgi:CubicO group peptidase (beta-lactamase class C family)
MRVTLRQIESWPVVHAAAAVIDPTGARTTFGPTERPFALASLSKPMVAWAILVAVEEGLISLDSPVGQDGCTMRHLLSHAGGYSFDGQTPMNAPARRRIYSNTGIELAANAVAVVADMSISTYVAQAVFEPLAMAQSALEGSAAHGVTSTINDLCRFSQEMLSPTLLSAETVSDAFSVQFADLHGVVPGVGAFRPCPWGLGIEIHGAKQKHWMGTTNTPEAVGHFGGAGTMMWAEPNEHIALVALTDRRFSEWSSSALRLWPQLSDAVLERARQ